MNNAKLYKRSNNLQKRDAKEVIEEFAQLLSESRTLLDIGCGSADVLMEIIAPRMSPCASSKIGGVDISSEMVKYASEKYPDRSLKFLKADIGSDFMMPKQNGHLKPGTFDFITSFYCLHWVQNQR